MISALFQSIDADNPMASAACGLCVLELCPDLYWSGTVCFGCYVICGIIRVLGAGAERNTLDLDAVSTDIDTFCSFPVCYSKSMSTQMNHILDVDLNTAVSIDDWCTGSEENHYSDSECSDV